MKKTEKNIPFERVLFFSDAIVAIAITLLALELRIDVPEGQTLRFEDLLKPWHKYLAFVLSFINIYGFWNTHHQMFTFIKEMDDRVKWFNAMWLFFIVALPFSTGVLSDHLSDHAAVFLYSLNIFLIALMQNFVWDYSAWERNNFVDDEAITPEEKRRYRVMFNLDMLNGLVAIVVSFFAPMTAFALLFFKIPLIVFASIYLAKLRRRGDIKRGIGRK